MIESVSVKEIQFGDVGRRISELTGLHFNTSGAWNAAKDGISFDMKIHLNECSGYYHGESQFLVFFDASPSDMTGYREGPFSTKKQELA